MTRADDWPIPHHLRERAAKLVASHPGDGKAAWLLQRVTSKEVERVMTAAIRSGDLRLWVAPLSERERPVAPSAIVELGRATIVSGCYRPVNDCGWLRGRPLFVKCADWAAFVRNVLPFSLHQDTHVVGPSDQSQARSLSGFSTAGAEHECRQWLAQEFADDTHHQRSKANFRSAALARFSGRLTERGFNLRVWPGPALEHNRNRAGAKRKS